VTFAKVGKWVDYEVWSREELINRILEVIGSGSVRLRAYFIYSYATAARCCWLV